MEIFNEFGQLPEIIGNGMYVVKQEPPAGTQVIIRDENKNEKTLNYTYKLYLSLPEEPEKMDENKETQTINTAQTATKEGTKK